VACPRPVAQLAEIRVKTLLEAVHSGTQALPSAPLSGIEGVDAAGKPAREVGDAGDVDDGENTGGDPP